MTYEEYCLSLAREHGMMQAQLEYIYKELIMERKHHGLSMQINAQLQGIEKTLSNVEKGICARSEYNKRSLECETQAWLKEHAPGEEEEAL